MDDMDHVGRRSVLACPDCHGTMWEIDEGELVRYRCHVGHAYTAEMMSVALNDALVSALGSSLRAMEERITLAQRLEKQATDSGREKMAQSWTQKVLEYERERDVLRDSMHRIDDIVARAASREDIGY